MEIRKTELPGVVEIIPKRFGDARGFFSEVFNSKSYAAAGVDVDFVQDNHSMSRDVGVVRGLHFQSPPHAQAKLVRVGAGRVRDVAVDIRVGSPTYGRWTAVELSAEAGNQLFIPAGFLHGFSVLEPGSELLYKCSDFYAPECDGAVRYDDPDLGIDWGVEPGAAILSAKDAAAQPFSGFESPFSYKATP